MSQGLGWELYDGDVALQGLLADLKYAVLKSGRWVKETVAWRGSVGQHSKLVFGANGMANVFFYSKTLNTLMRAEGYLADHAQHAPLEVAGAVVRVDRVAAGQRLGDVADAVVGLASTAQPGALTVVAGPTMEAKIGADSADRASRSMRSSPDSVMTIGRRCTTSLKEPACRRFCRCRPCRPCSPCRSRRPCRPSPCRASQRRPWPTRPWLQ